MQSSAVQNLLKVFEFKSGDNTTFCSQVKAMQSQAEKDKNGEAFINKFEISKDNSGRGGRGGRKRGGRGAKTFIPDTMIIVLDPPVLS